MKLAVKTYEYYSNMPRTAKVTSTKKLKSSDTTYPVLLECSKLASDDFWRQFYQDLSMGKGSRGIYISNGVIQSTNKRLGIKYNVTDKIPEIIIAELQTLLVAKTSVYSRKDLNKRKTIVNDIKDELDNYITAKWTSIKRKQIRIMLLVNYAIALRSKYGLSWEAAEEAYRVIINAFETKTHTSKDVVYENGKILDIEDIVCEEGVVINVREIKDDDTSEETTGCTGVYLQSLFEPYIQAWMSRASTV